MKRSYAGSCRDSPELSDQAAREPHWKTWGSPKTCIFSLHFFAIPYWIEATTLNRIICQSPRRYNVKFYRENLSLSQQNLVVLAFLLLWRFEIVLYRKSYLCTMPICTRWATGFEMNKWEPTDKQYTVVEEENVNNLYDIWVHLVWTCLERSFCSVAHLAFETVRNICLSLAATVKTGEAFKRRAVQDNIAE